MYFPAAYPFFLPCAAASASARPAAAALFREGRWWLWLLAVKAAGNCSHRLGVA